MAIDPNDPRRCKAITTKGQCPKEAVEGSSFCAHHSQGKDMDREVQNYMLTDPEIVGMMAHYSQVESLKSLREEISLVRALATKRLNMVESNADFLAACGQVNTLLITLDKLINSCYRLEVHLGTLLSKAAIVELAKNIVSILTEELETVDGFEGIIDRIGDKIMSTIAHQEQK